MLRASADRYCSPSILIGNPYGSPIPPFLLPAYRKPKRIRTAFSPAQLLKLEQAFEKNQYVVGAERKELARHLNLTETQVNRRSISRTSLTVIAYHLTLRIFFVK